MKREVADAVIERAQRHCEACGWPAIDLVLHHRKLKSRGGKDSVENLIAIHPKCHAAIHSTSEISESYGWIVKAGEDPATVEVQVQPWLNDERWAARYRTL